MFCRCYVIEYLTGKKNKLPLEWKFDISASRVGRHRLITFLFLLQGEAHSGEHGQDAQDGGRLAQGKARGQAEAEGGEGAESQAAGRGAGALRLQRGPPQPKVPGDGRRDREGREEETEAAEAQTEGGAGCSAPGCPALELEFSATPAVM